MLGDRPIPLDFSLELSFRVEISVTFFARKGIFRVELTKHSYHLLKVVEVAVFSFAIRVEQEGSC